MLFRRALISAPNNLRQFSVGIMSVRCPHCMAKRFRNEILSSCCLNGKVSLPPRPTIPAELMRLLKDNTFRKHIRKFNQGLAWTSLGASIDQRYANLENGVYTFRIQGQLHHQIGSLLPENNQDAKFGQIYFMDSQEQGRRRADIFDISEETFESLKVILSDCNNPYLGVYRQARDTIGNQ